MQGKRDTEEKSTGEEGAGHKVRMGAMEEGAGKKGAW